MNRVNNYLKELTQNELIDLLSELSEIKKIVNDKLDNKYISNLVKKLPTNLVSAYMLDESYTSINATNLKKWITDNLDNSEAFTLIKHFKLNPIYINSNNFNTNK